MYVVTMVTVDKAIIAKLERKNKSFEILVDPELAYSFKSGKSASIQKMLAVNLVFNDAKKGDRASSHDLEDAFNTQDVEIIAQAILKDGEIQMTTEFKRKKLEERRRQVADLIAKNALDPKTKMPHPLDRILNAMEQARVHIDLSPSEAQLEMVLKAIRPIIPISMEKVRMQVMIPAEHVGHAYGLVKELANIEKEEWMKNGDWFVVVSMNAGLKMEFIERVNHATKGNTTMKDM